MKKLYSLLTLIVCLLCSVTGAKAIDAPLLSDDSNTYLYNIKISAGAECYLSYATPEEGSSFAIGDGVFLKYTTSSTYTKIQFAFRASTTPGYYNIYGVIDGTQYPVCLYNTTDTYPKVYLMPTTSTPADWTIENATNGWILRERATSKRLKNYNQEKASDNSTDVYHAELQSGTPTSGQPWHLWVFKAVSVLTTDEVALGNSEYTRMAAARTTPALWNYATAVEAAQTAGSISESGSILGYPSSDAATTFLSTISKARNYTADFDATTFNTAVTTMLSTITMPKAGHIYKIQPVFSDGTTYDLYWDGTSANRINGDTDANLSSNKSTYFYCGASDNQFFFVNKDGRYLNWSDPGSTGKGYNDVCATDEYNATYNLWTLEPADPINGTVYLGTGSTAEATSATALNAWVDMLGRFQMKAPGANGSTTYYLVPRYPGDSDATMDFVSSGSDNKFYDAPTGKHRTYTFKLTEVTNYTPMSFASAGEGYATYSTPFPVVIPDDVKAYTATSYSSDNNQIKLTRLSGSYIPEGTGVLVKYTGDLPKTFIPVPAAVTNTEAGSVTDNQFVATGGDGTKVDDNNNTTAYILGVSNSELGFYKLSSSDRNIAAFRAYLTLPASATTEGAVKMAFDDEEVTGIHAAEINDSESQAPIYDLTGRRVKTTTAGSLYIKGGKKFIAK